MIREFGEQRTEKAVNECIRIVPDFISPARIREFVPAVEVVRNRCPRCKDSDGWIEVSIPGEKVPRVARCKHDGTIQCVATGTFGSRTYRNGWSG